MWQLEYQLRPMLYFYMVCAGGSNKKGRTAGCTGKRKPIEDPDAQKAKPKRQRGKTKGNIPENTNIEIKKNEETKGETGNDDSEDDMDCESDEDPSDATSSSVRQTIDYQKIREESMKRNADFLKTLGLDELKESIGLEAGPKKAKKAPVGKPVIPERSSLPRDAKDPIKRQAVVMKDVIDLSKPEPEQSLEQQSIRKLDPEIERLVQVCMSRLLLFCIP